MRGLVRKTSVALAAVLMMLGSAALALLPTRAFAENDSQSCMLQTSDGVYDNLEYGVSGVSVYITGWTGEGTTVDIPETINGFPVVAINALVFRDSPSITSVTFPSTLQSIGGGAFYGCTGLTSITIPESVTDIGQDAFEYCTGLRKITINARNVSLNGAFNNCGSELGCTVELGPNCETAGYTAFDNSNITEVIVGSSTKDIGDLFYNAPKLSKVTFRGDALETVGSWAFAICSSLKQINLPSSLKTLGNASFYRCTSLASITLPENLTRIEYDAFGDCTMLSSVVINSIDLDSSWAVGTFANAGQVTNGMSVTFGPKCSKVPRNLFAGSSSSDAP